MQSKDVVKGMLVVCNGHVFNVVENHGDTLVLGTFYSEKSEVVRATYKCRPYTGSMDRVGRCGMLRYRVSIGNQAVCGLSLDSNISGITVLSVNKRTSRFEFTHNALCDRIDQADCLADGMEPSPERSAIIRAWHTMRKALST